MGDVSARDSFEHFWKIFAVDSHYKVRLRFEEPLAPLILNARHHPGEEVAKRRDSPVGYKLELSSLEEIAWWVVGSGSLHLTVISYAREISANSDRDTDAD